jgi:hypothetical protein
MVIAGVLLHLPMFLMARANHYLMAGMPMDTGMLIGMVAIVLGVLLAGYGLLPSFPERSPGGPLRFFGHGTRGRDLHEIDAAGSGTRLRPEG